MALPWKEILTVSHVLVGIYDTMQAPMEKEDWDDETSNSKRGLHQNRCERLARDVASFEVDSHIKRVGILGDKTVFWGLLGLSISLSGC